MTKYTCLAVVNAFHASKDAVVASWSGLEYFSMVTTRFTQSLADLGGHLTQRAEDILLARHLRLLVGEDVACRAVRRAQSEDVLTAQAADRSIEHGRARRSDAHALSDLRSQPCVRRLLHHRQRSSDAVVRNEAQERRLLQLCREPLAQRVVEHRIAGRVGEVGEHDRVLIGQRRGTAVIDHRARDHGRDDDAAPIESHSARRRAGAGCCAIVAAGRLLRFSRSARS